MIAKMVPFTGPLQSHSCLHSSLQTGNYSESLNSRLFRIFELQAVHSRRVQRERAEEPTEDANG